MSVRLLHLSQKALGFSNLLVSRNAIRMLGAPPEEGRSLQRKMKEYKKIDEELIRRVDIGLPSPRGKDRTLASERAKILAKVKKDPEMERLARLKKLDVPLDKIEVEWEESGLASLHIKQIADHYGIFDHLFGYAYFYPRIMLDVEFAQEGDKAVPVYRGNIVKPREAQKPPQVSFKAEKDTLWTLVLTNPDGHLIEENAEYVHWFIGNIPGNDVSKGEVIFDYLPPFPPAGTGYQRLVFILYKQEGKVDYSSLKKPLPCIDLTQRTFKTLDFYQPRQDFLTPAGLAFCQTDYDYSVKSTFHNVLKIKEPKYEYDFPEHYIAPQKWFPNKVAFNVYLDRYRDPCEINKEYIVDRLKTYDPFQKEKKKLKFPAAQKLLWRDLELKGKMPTWLQRKKIFDSMGWGRINDSK
ncbi:hypothetical protein ONE63_009631 [Megalurothrips usitatus]|uniref:Large ribosomal subunit protein mL38 n=1 Tax=Megalurothrips usitatus TaxID=439358 RepID=A0AAV7XH68_9NEOP|nr:hypothetical protein ONE63_009631 [Megalurothrips usitatus]